MTELTKGSFVWYREYGHGIVTNPKSNAPYCKGPTSYISVWFENMPHCTRLHRNEVFARNDHVDIKHRNSRYFETKKNYSFYEKSRHNPNNFSQFTVKDAFGNINYVVDVRHHNLEQLKKNIDMNKKALLSTIKTAEIVAQNLIEVTSKAEKLLEELDDR